MSVEARKFGWLHAFDREEDWRSPVAPGVLIDINPTDLNGDIHKKQEHERSDKA
jgi:hypothetical protein